MKREEVITWLDRMTEFSLCAVVFTLPFSKSMVEIFFVAALVCWFTKRCFEYSCTLYPIRYLSSEASAKEDTLKDKILGLIKAFKPIETYLNFPIAGFVFVGFLATVNSISLSLSLEGFFFKLFEWIMIYFITVETINNKKKLNRILGVILSSIVLISIDGIFQFRTGTDFIRNYSMAAGYRIQGPFGNPNSFAGWLAVMTPIALSFAYFGKNKWLNLPDKYKWFKKTIKPMLWVITALLIACLALTYTNGAWIAFMLTLILVGIFYDKKLLILTVIALLMLFFVLPDPIKTSASSIFRTPQLSVYRHKLWREALGIIEDFPLLGCGLNTYTTVGPHYRISEETGYYPHNSYLHMAAESGLLGLGTFIWIMVTLFKTSLANLKRINSEFYSTFLIGFLAGLLGFLLHSFVDTNIYSLQLGNLMWFIMALIVAVQKISLPR